MNKFIVAAVAASGIALAGCSPTGVGTGAGAAIGAGVVLAAGGNLQQAAIGGLIGGAGGFVVSNLVQAQGQPPGVCQVYSNGQPVWVTPQGQPTFTYTGQPYLAAC